MTRPSRSPARFSLLLHAQRSPHPRRQPGAGRRPAGAAAAASTRSPRRRQQPSAQRGWLRRRRSPSAGVRSDATSGVPAKAVPSPPGQAREQLRGAATPSSSSSARLRTPAAADLHARAASPVQTRRAAHRLGPVRPGRWSTSVGPLRAQRILSSARASVPAAPGPRRLAPPPRRAPAASSAGRITARSDPDRYSVQPVRFGERPASPAPASASPVRPAPATFSGSSRRPDQRLGLQEAAQVEHIVPAAGPRFASSPSPRAGAGAGQAERRPAGSRSTLPHDGRHGGGDPHLRRRRSGPPPARRPRRARSAWSISDVPGHRRCGPPRRRSACPPGRLPPDTPVQLSTITSSGISGSDRYHSAC